MLVKNQQQPFLMGNETISRYSPNEFHTSQNGNTLPQSINNLAGDSFSQSLMQITEINSSVVTKAEYNTAKTEELSEVAAQKTLASAMPLLIQALEKLEADTTQLAEIYNQVTTDKGLLTKADILNLAELEEKITATRGEIEQIMSPLDTSELHTNQLSTLLLPVFEEIDAELDTLAKFNKKAAEQLAAIEVSNGNVDLDFTVKLRQEIFELIDQEKRFLPFSFAADDLNIINYFLNQNFNDDKFLSFQQSIKNTEAFIESFEKYQINRKEAYFAQKKLRV
ncbi:hypothetical protein [uncultured Paraglaciecola sp.]|uniref:hypothetical protein n=1 Tax=uncultured Paraglaciecola sp. TaxID=1765024 RepID=UPI0030D97054